MKKRILFFIDWYLPGYKGGGPIRSCVSLINQLKDKHDIYLVCRDRDAGDQKAYEGIIADRWENKHQIQIMYLSPSSVSFRGIYKVLKNTPVDYIYINSFFSYKFSIIPLLLRKLFFRTTQTALAPRGMLDQEALEIKKIKKRIYLRVSHLLGLYNNILWHVTNEQEKQSVQKIFGSGQMIHLAQNLPAIKPVYISRVKQGGKVSFIFVSRIVPIKNLHFAVKMLAQLPGHFDVTFDIYGPVDDEKYWDICRNAMSRLPDNIQINYKGVAANESLPELFGRYHFLFLPTLNENFGHVIMEALACSCPVIITKGTPWVGLTADFAGWDIPVEDEKLYLDVLMSCCMMGQTEYDHWTQGAFSRATTYANDQTIVNQSLLLFN